MIVITKATPGEFLLSPEEMRLIQAYRGLKDSFQEMTLDLTERCAAHPEHCRTPNRPALKLIASGNMTASRFNSSINSTISG